MILSFIPPLLGVDRPVPTQGRGTPGPAPVPATEGVFGFQAFFLALLGGRQGEQPVPEDAGFPRAQGDGAPLMTEGDAPEAPQGGEPPRNEGERRNVAPTVGRTTPAGWATLSLEGVADTPPPVAMDARVASDIRAARAGLREATTGNAAAFGKTMVPRAAEPSGATANESEVGVRVSTGVVRASRSEGVSGPAEVFRPAEVSRPTEVAGSAEVSGSGIDVSRSTVGVSSPIQEGDAPHDLNDTAGTLQVAATGWPSMAAVQGPDDVRKADRSPAHLDPELRAKVERVMERMSTEHGYDVTLVEGYRTPERQRHLFAQGRTRPGPVVTWTRESLHSHGRAVDLKVEGPWGQREAYVVLQKVAREEGLGTLGMKDPGHLELRLDPDISTSGRSASNEGSAGGDERGEDAFPRPMRTDAAPRAARTAHVPSPAQVAQVAQVARRAQVAPTMQVGTVRQGVADVSSEPNRRKEADAAPEPNHGLQAPAAPEGRPEAAPAHPARTFAQGTPATVAEVSGVVSPDIMDRVGQVMEARDAFTGQAPQRVTVRMDGTAGPVERVRVEMLDQALGGDVQVGDPVLAARLKGDAGDLLRTLQDLGFDPQSLTVNQLRATADAARDGLGGFGRTEGALEVLRALVGAQAGTAGRDSQQRPEGGGRQGHQPQNQNQNGPGQQSRRDNRRETP